MAKVFLSAGHGGTDPGAVANGLKEKEINLTMMLACRDELKRHGVNVVCSRIKDEDDSVGQEVKEANTSKVDLAVSFHTNAGGGDGFEAFYNTSNKNGKKLAELGEKYIKSLGQNSRGLKSGNHLYFIKNTKMTSVLFECFFIDSKDKNIGDTTKEQKAFGVAYAKAILEYLGIKYKAETKTEAPKSTEEFKIKIKVDSLNIRAKATVDSKVKGVITNNEKLVKLRPSYYFKDCAYTITKQSNGWGYLKSGLGWINLSYVKRV